MPCWFFFLSTEKQAFNTLRVGSVWLRFYFCGRLGVGRMSTVLLNWTLGRVRYTFVYIIVDRLSEKVFIRTLVSVSRCKELGLIRCVRANSPIVLGSLFLLLTS